MDDSQKEFPEGMEPIGNREFQFECHPEVECFTFCCRDVDLTLYPYDVLRLKTALCIDSEQFVREHTYLVRGENPFFPTVKLKLADEKSKPCPFLTNDGCTVYDNRPSACRTYPLEMAVDRREKKGRREEFYFLTDHNYCLGHRESNKFTVKSWVRNQRLDDFNTMNALWAELETIFRKNPWKGEGAGGEKQQLAFMVCYNIDGFRRFAEQHKLLSQYRIDKDFRKRIANEDSELQKFGFEWLKLILIGTCSLIRQ